MWMRLWLTPRWRHSSRIDVPSKPRAADAASRRSSSASSSMTSGRISASVVLLVTFGRKGRPSAPLARDADPKESPRGFRGSRTPASGDRRPSFPVERCGKGQEPLLARELLVLAVLEHRAEGGVGARGVEALG